MENTSLSKLDLIRKGQPSGIDWRKPVKLAVIAFLIYAFVQWGLPWIEIGIHRLLKTVGEMIMLGIAGGFLFLMVLLISKPGFRRAVNAIIESIAKLATLGAISFDEWIFQEKQIDLAEENVVTSEEETKKIEGIAVRLNKDVQENITSEKEARKIYEIAVRDSDDEKAEDAQAEEVRCREFIDTIGPIVEDMKSTITISYDLQKKLKRNIKNLRLDLQKEKAKYNAYMAGSKGLSALRKAWIGDPGLNKDAELAKEKVREKIALFTGTMRTNMEILGQMSKDQNYRDRARFELAREKMKQLSEHTETGDVLTPEIPHSTTFDGINMPKVTISKPSSYDDLIS